MLLFLGGATALQGAPPVASDRPVRKVSIKTGDGWTIRADYRPPRPRKPVAILVHGAESGKYEWESFSKRLGALGMGTLAIDLRGHAESTAGPRGKETFRAALDGPNAWPSAREDIRAAERYVRKRASGSAVGIVGASIGANLASEVFREDRRAAWLVLLSPGIEYRGVRLAAPDRGPVAVAASPGDPYAFGSARLLARQAPFVKFIPAPRGHGVQMFSDARFTRELLDWIAGAAGLRKRREPGSSGPARSR